MADRRRAYVRSGVDVTAGERTVELIREAVESTRRPEVLSGLGGFAGAVGLPSGLRDPILVSATDGVGTKTAIASALDRFDTIGIDLVAMCADDVVCSGAAPLFFLDYVVVGRLDPGNVAELVGGVAAGCRTAGCALVGGETAEHPGMMGGDEFDLAGFCVGVMERDRWIDGSGIRPGDAIVGLAASGLHANGFSLVRALLAQYDLDLRSPYQERLRRSIGDAATEAALAVEPNLSLATLGEVLLTPTTIYAGPILRLRTILEAGGRDVLGIAHITGGGLPGNVPRMLGADLAVRLDPTTWAMPSVMRLFGALGGLEDDEVRATFNGGLGMVIAVAPDAVDPTIAALDREGIAAWHVGQVVERTSSGARYAEGPIR